MLAATLDQTSGETSFKLREIPSASPGRGEVTVEVRAAALNHLDLYGFDTYRGDPARLPRVIGSDAAGVISAVGEDVDQTRLGDEVVINPGLACGACESCLRGQASECGSFDIVGRGAQGTLAELVTVPAENVRPKPVHLDFEQAAALPLAHLTAARMLFERGRLASGQSVLIHGIGGGVALAALQLAKLSGACVIVTSSSETKLQSAIDLGADKVVDYAATANVVESVRELTAGRGVDLTIDTVGAATLPASIGATRNGGRVVICGATTGAEGAISIREVFWRQISIVGSTMGSHEDFRRMLSMVEANRLVPVIDSVVPLSRVGDGLERMRRGRQFGKIVILPGSPRPEPALQISE